jgi:indole-3-glycerol phosphate synthase
MAKDFLSIIVDHKKTEIKKAQRNIDESALEKQARKARNVRPFYGALSKPADVHIIAEIKRASPSKGNIAIDLDPATLAAQYQQGGASCLSVLTDQEFFKGGFADFRSARNACDLPMLRKDFLISRYQIFESAVLGADAVLLIARILSPEELKDLYIVTRDLGMDALVEIHSEQDLESAVRLGARLIGINNRNLSSFETNLDTATTLAGRLNKDQIPVAASGISNRDDIIRNTRCGIHHFLIGESLVRADDTVSFMKTLIHGEPS